MIPLFKRLIHAFFYDELSAIRWIRGALLGTAGLLAMVPDGTFGIPGWAFKVAAAAMAGIGGSIVGGQKNDSPEALAEKLKASGYTVIAPADPTPSP